MKKIILICLISIYFMGCQDNDEQAICFNPYLLKVVFEGDSQSVLLSQETDKIIGYYNNGIAGSGTVNIIDRIKIMKNMEPDIIVLTIGTNDMKDIVNIPQGETITEFEENYKYIVKEYKKITDKIIVTSIQPVNSDLFLSTYGRTYQIVRNDVIIQMNDIIKSIAFNENIIYIDEWKELYDPTNNILKYIYDSGDGLHWNNSACRLHLNNVIIAIKNYKNTAP